MNQRKFIKDHFEFGEDVPEIKNKLDVEFGHQALSISSVYRRVGLLKCGYTELNDAPRPGRGIDEQLLARISTIIEEEPCSSLRYISNALNESESTVYRYLTLYLHKKYMHTKWIPHSLTNPQKKSRVNGAKELLTVLLACQKINWLNIITGDQSWFQLSYGIDGAWLDDGEERPECDGSKIQLTKIMVTFIWGVHGIFLIDFLPEGESYNSSYFIENVLIPIHSKRSEMWRDSKRRLIWLHLDNSKIHNSEASMKKTIEFKFKRAPQPAYSPDISPTDFFMWGYIKDKLKGKIFKDIDALYEAIAEIANGISMELKKEVFNNWIERCKYVISHGGKYYNKD